MMPDLRRTRQCGDCSECCTGTLTADIHGHKMEKGRPCHFFANGCSIYPDRPQVCSAFQCAWLRDDGTEIPEWMRPDLSKVIIVEYRWGNNNEKIFWSVVESGQKIDSLVLNWLYMYLSKHDICANIEVGGTFYQRGPAEFREYIETFNANSLPKKIVSI